MDGNNTEISQLRPDLRAHQRAVRADFATVAKELCEILGARLTAYLGSVQETRAAHEWAEGKRLPSELTQTRLRLALQIAIIVATNDSHGVTQAWFQGLNPQLDDRSPAWLLREGDVNEAGPLVIAAARSFLVGG